MFHLVQLLPLLALLASTAALATPRPRANDGFTLVDQDTIGKLDAMRQRWGIAGISIGLVASPDFVNSATGSSDNSTRWYDQSIPLGQANAKQEKMTADTLYAIGSNSKHFASIAANMLIANGTKLPSGQPVTLQTKLKDILPEWKAMDGYASEHVDLIDLMSHRTGIPRHDAAWGAPLTPTQLVSGIGNLRPSTEIRYAYQYSNTHYVILSAVIEKLSGMPFADFIQEHIFGPVGMDRTTYDLNYAKAHGPIVDGFTHQNVSKAQCIEYLQSDKASAASGVGPCLGDTKAMGWWSSEAWETLKAAGSVITNINDMNKWMNELLSPSVIPPAVLQAITQTYDVSTRAPEYPGFTSLQTYGLGQWRYTYRGHELIGHYGGVFGQLSFMLRVPTKGIAMIVGVNDWTYGQWMIQAVGFTLLDQILGLKPVDWEGQFYKKVTAGYLASAAKSAAPASTEGKRAPLDADQVVGKYTDAGYGDLAIQPVTQYANQTILAALQTALAGSAPASGSSSGDSTSMDLSQVYIAQVDKISVTHYVFTPFDGPVYNFTALWHSDLYDTNGNVEGVAVYPLQQGNAVFKDNGVGLWGIWGQGEMVDPKAYTEADVQGQAEVWYGRG
ncbi:hypothetical protein IAU60_005373 [Kwoniella sp. DSM 27419]